MTVAVRRHRETIFNESDRPACEDDEQEWLVGEFQVTVLREGHEDIRDRQQRDRRKILQAHGRTRMKHVRGARAETEGNFGNICPDDSTCSRTAGGATKTAEVPFNLRNRV
jgi:hypothetical protein